MTDKGQKMNLLDKFITEQPIDRQRVFQIAAEKILSDEAICTLIDMGFCDAPASTKYHGAYPGGLLKHSLNVMDKLNQFTTIFGLKWQRPESPIIIGLLHDLCKVDQYKKTLADQESGKTIYTWNNEPTVKGHGMKSVIYIQRYCGIVLTEEEIACIIYHMGAFCPKEEWGDFTDAIHKYPNVLWTHTADMYATHIQEVE